MEEDILGQILQLTSSGYTVSFSKVEEYAPSNVLRIELCKGEMHHVELLDISIEMSEVLAVKVPYLINRALRRADFYFRYDFEREKKNEG